eukprot:6524258-Prymnesium_polylepis.1
MRSPAGPGDGAASGQRRRSAVKAVNMLRETDGTWDDGYSHAWTQVRAALRPRGIVHRKAPRVQPRCSPPKDGHNHRF